MDKAEPTLVPALSQNSWFWIPGRP